MKFLQLLPVIIAGMLISFMSSWGSPRAATNLPLVLAASENVPSPPSPGYTFDIQAILGTAGVTSVLVWYLYYTTSVAFPKMRQDFRDEMTTERAHHEKITVENGERLDRLIDKLGALADELRTKPLGKP